MSEITTDPRDPRLTRGIDDKPTEQAEAYLILPQLAEELRAQGFVRPVRCSYVHQVCGTLTTMSRSIAETYAKDPKFYGATYCCACRMHRPVSEFTWSDDGSEVGS